MSTFAQLSQKPNVGVAYTCDISFNDFSTTAYRWSTHFIVAGGNQYDGVIQSLGNLSRALGVNNVMTAATVELTLDNTSGLADWLCDRSTFLSQTLRAVFRLSVVLWDPQNTSDQQTLQLGIFSCLDYPKRDVSTVKVSLADDLCARGGQLAPPPSIQDWINAAGSDAPSAVVNRQFTAPNVDYAAPAPLLFGTGPHTIQRIATTTYLVCAVAGSAGGAPAVSITIYDKFGNVAPFGTITAHRSVDIVGVNGRTYHFLYYTLDLPYTSGSRSGQTTAQWSGPQYAEARSQTGYDQHDAIGPLVAVGSPFSQVSNFVGTGATAQVHPASVAQDLLQSYTASTGILTIDGTSFNEMRTLRPLLRANGRIQAAVSSSLQQLTDDMTKALSGIALAGAFDLIYGKDGAVHARANTLSFSSVTSTPQSIDEPLMKDVQETWPSKGERGEPYTRLMMVWNGARYPGTPQSTMETTIGRFLEKVVDVSWLAPDSPYGSDPKGQIAGYAMGPIPGVWVAGSFYRTMSPASGRGMCQIWERAHQESVHARPALTFRTTMAAMSFELGDIVTLSWTRGLRGTPYNSARFRVEAWTLSPFNADAIALRLVWVDEVASLSLNPFLLDDETLITRVAASGGRTASVTDSSSTVTFSSGNLFGDGVSNGDILVLQDATEAGNSFKRNRALYILNVSGATTLLVANLAYAGGIDFGTGVGTPVAVGAWTIYRGASTYPTAISDPTNYPSGGAMYGKISNSAAPGFFIDGTTKANILSDG